MALAAALLLLAALPLFRRCSALRVTLFRSLLLRLLAQAWNIVGGYAGTVGGPRRLPGHRPIRRAALGEKGITPWVGMFVGGALAAALRHADRLPRLSLRAARFYFVLLTVAFAEICRIIASNTDSHRRAVGYYITFTGDPRQFQSRTRARITTSRWRSMLAATASSRGSRAGDSASISAPFAGRERERGLGVDTFRYKMLG